MSQVGTRLVGNDGRLVQASIGTATETTILPQSWAQVAAKIQDTLLSPTIASSTSTTITFSATVAAALSAGDFVRFTYLGTQYSFEVQGVVTTVVTIVGSGCPVMTAQTLAAYKSSRFGSLVVGDFYFNPKGTTVTLTGADTVHAVTFVTMADLTSWSFDLSVDEVNTTVLADTVKKYRKGKQDASGQLEFMFIKGTTDLAGGLTNYFLDIKDIAGTGSIVVTPRKTSPLFVIGYLDEDTASAGYTMAILMQIELFSFSLPMQDSTPVKASPKFRLAGSLNPALYRITNP